MEHMSIEQIRQVIGTDNDGVVWVALIGASIVREDGSGTGKAILDIRHVEGSKYEILFYGGEHLALDVEEGDVTYSSK